MTFECRRVRRARVIERENHDAIDPPLRNPAAKSLWSRVIRELRSRARSERPESVIATESASVRGHSINHCHGRERRHDEWLEGARTISREALPIDVLIQRNEERGRFSLRVRHARQFSESVSDYEIG